MPKQKLTKDVIDTAIYHGKDNSRYVLWDTKTTGLGLRVYPSGRKAFILSYRDSGGADRMATIGDYGNYTLDKATTRAKVMLREVDGGEDPLELRKAKRDAPTFGALAEAYGTRHAPTKKTGAEDMRRIAKHLSAWNGRKLASISDADVNALIAKIGSTAPYEANRTLALISKMFALAHKWKLLPTTAANPAQGADRFKEKSRKRWVTPAELPKLAQAIDAEPSQHARAALWLYLLTGCRKRELLNAQWCDIDLNRAVLCLPETKNGSAHEVPLSVPALAILEALPKLSGNPFVFPGLVKGMPLESIRGPWERVREAAGCTDIRLHDLRRTVGSWMVQSGNSLALIGKVLNHSNTSTTAIYARFAQDTERTALEAHAIKLLGAAGKLPTAEVVPIAKGRKVSVQA